ncbi:HDOD domain-containing protein [Alteromonas sp. ASW11-36]|uniref:HDOD domain-containing protein n=1 Tax=Alteromonas arenosi TaxID=3055817 RepID=A0ABT7SUL5_9ALTE|nr:HDOD domain-containing protein [Alteromonas sp. ASW11-36]MDM7859887.1 HDOD domain-containing protein [Alteromonas sp. ASW11-36]
MGQMSQMDWRLTQTFSVYMAENVAVDLLNDAQVDEGQAEAERLFGKDSDGHTAARLFNLGREFPVADLGIYANVLTSSVTVENWFDALVEMLTELSDEQALFLSENTVEGVQLSIPLYPTETITQCVLAGLVYQLASYAELIAKQSVACQLHPKFGVSEQAKSSGNILFCLTIRSQHLSNRLTHANPRVYNVFKRQLNVMQKGRKNQSNVEFKVMREIGRVGDWANVTQSSVASALAMSERSLTRKLQQEGLKFRDIVVAARNSEALSLLFKGMPIGQVSDSLGFSDRATFERSFKKWQGLSPAKIQAQYALLAAETAIDNIVNATELPHLPNTITQLLQLLKQDETDLDEVIELLETDPVLVAKILRIANSSMYANVKADTLKQAVIAIFGFDKLYALTLSIMSTAMFAEKVDSFDYRKFWQHALLTVWVIEQLVELHALSKDEAEYLSLAGLLHSIGELVIHYCLPNKVAQYTGDFSEHVTWREHNHYQKLKLGTCTTAVSSFVCHLWHIPKPVCELIDILTPQGRPKVHLLVEALDIVDYLLFPTKQTQTSCKMLVEKHWGLKEEGRRFLEQGKAIRDELYETANALI